jgi:hypothetical protein
VARLFKKKVDETLKKGKPERPVLIEIYKWADGTLEAYNGGTIPIKIDTEGDFEFMGKSCEVTILDAGIVPTEKVQIGVSPVIVTEDRDVDATNYIDSDKLEKLTEDEKELLEYISYSGLYKIVLMAFERIEKDGGVFTSLENAASQAVQELGLPKSKYVYEPKYENRSGRTIRDFDVRLSVGDSDCTEFVTKALWNNIPIGVEEGDNIAERSYCASGDKREYKDIYRFSVPKSYFK